MTGIKIWVNLTEPHCEVPFPELADNSDSLLQILALLVLDGDNQKELETRKNR
ncbi:MULTISPECIES: hypothetical protein [Sphingobium]|uniref:Uncharacterized protein n=1 Tax=Sphingobium fuliginis (strain ATCC 27551) TaxID=336203 RepID=A0A292ZAS4_SPHSA|nr:MULTISPECIES: hypothetical protein [Sphingobium]WDA39239.1 hypothetical protein PO876_25915 [Sphingobium sp. YC-XJ3]GAY19979.1 hypothetical protein SFOMI_0501 [Sphingobium fuliginis]